MEKHAIISSVNTSAKKGEVKSAVKEIRLTDQGIEGDAHAGPHHRQVSLLAVESIQKYEQKTSSQVPLGGFGENITTEGFALLDIWDLCTAYFVPNNKFSRRKIDQTMDDLKLESGVLYRRERAEFATEYRIQAQAHKGGLQAQVVQPASAPTLDRRFHFVVAGSAGGRVRSAARLVATAAMQAGWWSAQRDDYPITVKTGPSVSEVIVSPEEVNYSGVDRPDLLVIVSEEGLAKSALFLANMSGEDTVFLAAGLARPVSAARILTVDMAASDKPIPKASRALAMVAHAVEATGVVPFDLFEEVAGRGAFGQKNLDLIAAGVALSSN